MVVEHIIRQSTVPMAVLVVEPETAAAMALGAPAPRVKEMPAATWFSRTVIFFHTAAAVVAAPGLPAPHL